MLFKLVTQLLTLIERNAHNAHKRSKEFDNAVNELHRALKQIRKYL